MTALDQPDLLTNGAGPERKLFIRDLADGQAVESVFMVRERILRKKRNGENFLRLTLADASGRLPAVCWEGALDVHDLAAPGTAVRVRGRFAHSDRYGPQLTIEALVAAQSGEFDPGDLHDGPAMNVEQMEADLRELIATVRNPHLHRLLDRLFGPEAELWRRFRRAPAAKFYHQAYGHGLLEHTLLVAQAVSAISASFPGVDRDLAVTGALVHDIGKIEAYGHDSTGEAAGAAAGEAAGAIDLTDDGKLHGEISLGYYLVRRTTEQLDGFPWELARALLHIVLAHHGALENGSPVVPATREATVVHAIDNLGGKLGCFDRLEKELPDGESWSQWDRALAGPAYFAGLAAVAQPIRLASAE
jgi:3'-5' exoribonuclease